MPSRTDRITVEVGVFKTVWQSLRSMRWRRSERRRDALLMKSKEPGTQSPNSQQTGPSAQQPKSQVYEGFTFTESLSLHRWPSYSTMLEDNASTLIFWLELFHPCTLESLTVLLFHIFPEPHTLPAVKQKTTYKKVHSGDPRLLTLRSRSRL